MRAKELFSLFCRLMFIGKRVDHAMKGDSVLNTFWVIKFLFTLYKIAYKITDQYFRFVERKICMREVVDRSAP